MPKNSPKRWALYAHGVGNQCPVHGLSMPSTWSLSAHVTGIKRPAHGPYNQGSIRHLFIVAYRPLSFPVKNGRLYMYLTAYHKPPA